VGQGRCYSYDSLATDANRLSQEKLGIECGLARHLALCLLKISWQTGPLPAWNNPVYHMICKAKFVSNPPDLLTHVPGESAPDGNLLIKKETAKQLIISTKSYKASNKLVNTLCRCAKKALNWFCS
jgi:hypothetical protein